MAEDDEETPEDADVGDEPEEEADEDLDLGDEDEDADGEIEADGKRDMDKRKLVLLAAVGVLVLVVGGAATLYFTGVFGALTGAEGEGEAEHDPNRSLSPSVYFELPEMLVDLKTGSCRAPFLKLRVQLEVADKKDVGVLEEAQPHIMDRLQTHLRTLERQDLVGREGAERLRLDIIRIVNNVSRPVKVREVLFKEFLLQ